MNEVNQLKKLMEAVQLNEYMFNEGEPIQALLDLNLFTDADADERPSSYNEEFADDADWMKIETKYYDRIAPRMARAIRSADGTLSDDDVDAITEVFYDGDDAYSSIKGASRFLPEIYDEQIEVIERLLGFNDDFERIRPT